MELASIEKFADQMREAGLLLPVWFEKGRVVILDQTQLPWAQEVIQLETVDEVAQAITAMQVRGSGAIACTAVYGMLLAALSSGGNWEQLAKARDKLIRTRPTAIALSKAVEEIWLAAYLERGDELIRAVEDVTLRFVSRQVEMEKRIGQVGAELVGSEAVILTHCHSGALAGAGYGGRALSIVRAAVEQGKKIKVIATETRPYLQGARITAWELQQLGIPVTLITDNMVGWCLQTSQADLVVVGSDRLAANGDTANKVGTYPIALAAQDNAVPFYVSATGYNIDLSITSGAEIPIEIRDANELLIFQTQRIAPDGIEAIYPAFDITPARLISAIITERGVVYPPFTEKLRDLFQEEGE